MDRKRPLDAIPTGFMAWQPRHPTSCPGFSFLVHPRSVADLLRQGIGRFVREHSNDDHELLAKIRTLPPTVVGEARFGFAPVYGELVCVPRLPEDMTAGPAREWVGEALRVAAARGARVVGLGALTSTATGGGLRLLDRLPPGVTLTNGNAFTAAVVARNALDACAVLGRPDPVIAVLGATGSVGGLLSRLLAEEGGRLILIGRTVGRVRRMLPDLARHAIVAENLSVLREADVIVAATHDEAARVTPCHVRPHSIVIDCAQPDNVTAEARAALSAAGIPVIRGGLVRPAAYHSSYDFGHRPRDTMYACLAETYLFALEGLREHSVGRPTLDLARRLAAAAGRHGLKTLPVPAPAPVPQLREAR